MPYDIMNEVKKVKEYYEQDPLQKRFSCLITGESGSGKTFMVSTARMPVHIDSFDPGGTKCLRSLINEGLIIADTRWEKEDPFNPTVFEEWKKETDRRFDLHYFDLFGTYVLDSASSFADAVMNHQLGGAGLAGEIPRYRKDYTPQKVNMINRIKKFMNLSCDFIMTGHLKELEETLGKDKDGNEIKQYRYRFLTTGQASVTIPMQFDELYVLIGKEGPNKVKRSLIIESQGKYIARSRLKADGKLDITENPNIKEILKKVGLPWKDKPLLNMGDKK